MLYVTTLFVGGLGLLIEFDLLRILWWRRRRFGDSDPEFIEMWLRVVGEPPLQPQIQRRARAVTACALLFVTLRVIATT
jgi:hypothetical protein